jgi:hypothetical protein
LDRANGNLLNGNVSIQVQGQVDVDGNGDLQAHKPGVGKGVYYLQKMNEETASNIDGDLGDDDILDSGTDMNSTAKKNGDGFDRTEIPLLTINLNNNTQPNGSGSNVGERQDQP